MINIYDPHFGPKKGTIAVQSEAVLQEKKTADGQGNFAFSLQQRQMRAGATSLTTDNLCNRLLRYRTEYARER